MKETITIKKAQYSNYEGNEILWSYAKTKERAYLEMVFSLLDSADKDKIQQVVLDKIKLERVYFCNNCEFSTSGDDLCCECGEPTGKVGKHVWQLDLY